MAEDQSSFKLETVTLDSIKAHPRNYRIHPDDQIEHLIASIKQHGLYRNIVIAKDGTILAGHGVSQACKKMGLIEIPVIRLNVNPDEPAALKVLAGDNEITHLGEIDDRALSEILKEIKDTDISGLIGTGYDVNMLANLVMITRPASEIADKNEAAQWVGMPEYTEIDAPLKMIIAFKTIEERKQFCELVNIPHSENKKISSWWPTQEKQDLSALKFVEKEELP